MFDRSRLLAATLVLFSSSSPGLGQVLLTLDPATIPPGIQCDETWIEAGVELSFMTTTAEDCTPGICNFGIGLLDPGGVDLFQVRLSADLSGLDDVSLAEIDVTDYCGAGCTKAFFYDGAVVVDSATNSFVSVPETVELTAVGRAVDRLVVSSCEASCVEIRLDLGAVGVESVSWSEIKSFRSR